MFPLSFMIDINRSRNDWVVPKYLRTRPIHRWFVFPHSFSNDLVYHLIEKWGLSTGDRVLDPFAGAGTTLLSAKEKGISSTGYDISPWSVLVCGAKTATYDKAVLSEAFNSFLGSIKPGDWVNGNNGAPELLRRALPGNLLAAFSNLVSLSKSMPLPRQYRDCVLLAVLSLIPQYSRAVPTGGWLKWVDNRTNSRSLLTNLENTFEVFLDDVGSVTFPFKTQSNAHLADARGLPDPPDAFSAVITSPPYPNRHDYTRVFNIELFFLTGLTAIQEIRRQSFHSHPESKPSRPRYSEYVAPLELTKALKVLNAEAKDKRIPRMVEGYFVDMYLALKEMKRVLKANAPAALVLGNVQYSGVPILVDEIVAEIGASVGLRFEGIQPVRFRGNSAQQMKSLGKHPSRESIVFFKN